MSSDVVYPDFRELLESNDPAIAALNQGSQKSLLTAGSKIESEPDLRGKRLPKIDAREDVLWSWGGRECWPSQARYMVDAIASWNKWTLPRRILSANAWGRQRESYAALFEWFLSRNEGRRVFLAFLNWRRAWSWRSVQRQVSPLVNGTYVPWRSARDAGQYRFEGIVPEGFSFLRAPESKNEPTAQVLYVTRSRQVEDPTAWGFRDSRNAFLLEASPFAEKEALKQGTPTASNSLFDSDLGIYACPHVVLGAIDACGQHPRSENLFITLSNEGFTASISLPTTDIYLSKFCTMHPEVGQMLSAMEEPREQG